MQTANTKNIKNFIRSGGYAWPGGYPSVLIMKDGECLCATCARENWRLIARSTRNGGRDDWAALGVNIHWEGDQMICANCYREIDSAYGVAE